MPNFKRVHIRKRKGEKKILLPDVRNTLTIYTCTGVDRLTAEFGIFINYYKKK